MCKQRVLETFCVSTTGHQYIAGVTHLQLCRHKKKKTQVKKLIWNKHQPSGKFICKNSDHSAIFPITDRTKTYIQLTYNTICYLKSYFMTFKQVILLIVQVMNLFLVIEICKKAILFNCLHMISVPIFMCSITVNFRLKKKAGKKVVTSRYLSHKTESNVPKQTTAQTKPSNPQKRISILPQPRPNGTPMR